MDEAERTVYEKILAAHLWSRRNPRLGPDEFLRPLLTPEERSTEAYITYDYLQGRLPAFAPFLTRVLGYASAEAAREELGGRYQQALDARLSWYQETGR